MKLSQYIGILVLVSVLLFPVTSAFAQTLQVPITYPGDTDETIARRAQWIEGAMKERKVVWWGILRPELKNRIIAEFNKIYPYIKVDHWRGRGEEIAAKIEAEFAVGRINSDVVLGGEPYNYPRWRKKGMLAKFTDMIPEINNLDKRLYSKFGDYATPGNNGITPQYNTNLVSEAEAPKSWDDLLDPKWKGHIGMTRDVKVWSTIAVAEGGWGIEKTERFLNRLKEQDIIWTSGHSTGHTLLIAGEFKIFAEEYVYHTLLSKEKGAPVEWAKVKPVVCTGPSFTLQMMAPHPNSARLFLEWVFSPQGLLAYDKITYYGAASPGTGTRLSRELAGLDLCFRTEEVELKVVELGLIPRFSRALGILQ